MTYQRIKSKQVTFNRKNYGNLKQVPWPKPALFLVKVKRKKLCHFQKLYVNKLSEECLPKILGPLPP